MIDGAVFSGALDGYLRAYDTSTGKVLWAYDTNREFETVNGVKAHAGAHNGPGSAIVDGHVYVNSAYGMWNDFMPGSALLVFSVDD